MENLKTKTIGEFVAEDFRAAAVFQKHKIDFCCRGGRTLEEVCEKKNLAADELLESLKKATSDKGNQSIDYKSWHLDLLVDYIEKKHHRYVEATIPTLLQYLNKLCSVHGGKHPELFEITKEFQASANELVPHMKKEEMILFPFIRKMVNAKLSNQTMEATPFGTVENPISMMMQDHDNEGVRFRKIAALTNDYTPPADGCTTYKVAFVLLQEFEADLHTHIHLENNIVFNQAVALEKELA